MDQWLLLDPMQWELTTKVDGRWRRSIQPGQTSREREIETGVRLRQTGAVLDRRIATFGLEIEPVQTKGRFTSNTVSDDRDANTLNYSATVSALHGTPFPFGFTGNASQSTGTTESSLGARSEFTSTNRGVAANWKSRYFPSTLSYDERSIDSLFTSAFNNNRSERDEVVRTLKYHGRSSKMDFSLERSMLDDRIQGRDRDYNDTRARLGHRLRWGKGSRLHSRFRYNDRTGFNPRTRVNLNESAYIQHTKNLNSNSSYQFASTKTTNTTTSHAANVSLTHKLYNSLTTTGGVSGTYSESDFSETKSYSGNLGLGYIKRIPWGGTFSAGVGGSYGITDVKSQQALLDVIDESHVVPASLIVVLDNRLIDVTTIIVTDAPGVVTFTEGVDYTVADAGGGFTQLNIILGGGINAADTILVSYKFQSLPSVKISTRSFNWRTELDYGWISVFHSESRTDQNRISGASDTFLTDDRETRTGIELKWEDGPTRARATGEKRFTKTGGFETDALEFDQSLSHRFSRDATFAIGTAQTFTESNNQTVDFYSGDASFFWHPIRNLTIRPNARLWLRKDQGTAATGDDRFERLKGVGLDARWNWRKIEVLLRYNHDARKASGGTDTVEDRITVTLIRRSF